MQMPRQPSSLLSLRDLSGLPLAAELLRESFRKLMDSYGYVVFRNVPKEFDPVGFCSELGEFIPQYTGVLVGDVVPEPGMDEYYHAGNSKALVPHSEGYEFSGLPPRYLALWCVQPAYGGGGETTLADGYQWISTLNQQERVALKEKSYEFISTDALRSRGIHLSSRHPILLEYEGTPIVSISCNNMIHEDIDEFAMIILAKAQEFFRQQHVAVDYNLNDMLVFNNWRMLHARNAFTDLGRHLKRIQIGLKSDCTDVVTA
jgi:alpha-ketoglutarate-dependent taurine dioxygenase